jgi:Transposase DDE domain
MAHGGHVSKKYHRFDLGACLRELFPASFWKSVRQEFKDFDGGQTKWSLPLCWCTGLFMALSGASTMHEGFECARECVTALYFKRRRCGKTLAGYTKAMSRFPLAFFARVREQMHRNLKAHNVHAARIGRWNAFAIDGSKQNIPRTLSHELKYGLATKGTAKGMGAPQSQVVAAVAMGKNVMWDWECDSALVGEREMALSIIARLPALSLSVLDAGFLGYEWAKAIQAMNQYFLVRVGANVRLWVEGLNKAMAAEWKDGEVWLWPDGKRKHAPLVLRLIRLETKAKASRRKSEMWLVTNVLDESKLTREEASALYQKRWRANECTFRDWKKTLDESKLDSRTPEMSEREQELGLCAMQMLQVATWIARKQSKKETRRNRNVSVAKAQREWRKAARDLAAGRSTKWLKAKLVVCVGDDYIRKSKKVRRAWPERKAHETPKAPLLRRLTKELKTKGTIRLDECKKKAS